MKTRAQRPPGVRGVTPRTRRERAVLDGLKKAAVWIFLAIFVFSIAGATFVTALR